MRKPILSRGTGRVLGLALALVVVLLGRVGRDYLAPRRTNAPPAPASATDAPGSRAAFPWNDPERRAAIERTLDAIARGGPFAHRHDGAVFRNAEGRLPARPLGYYREYTVETPGTRERGARRIVRGDGGELYYSDDHYRSFARLDPP